ncbi:YqaJ viral recombinase family protein [Sediminibacillus massiliensis]|uniref:YqaJ viral recombinase family protein n=1 Tax=Sediminibacillus massiliensis TaxID=1926277 RepID=UPI00098888F3|nr:YqaJ viral recombinase family protein [Sediminibacillus massiliensis]
MITDKQDRCHFIGGSESHYIYMNYETATFKSWWKNKLEGVNEDSFSNLSMAVGTILEHDVIALYEQINGISGEKDKQMVKGIARANTDYIHGSKVSDVKVSKQAASWHKKGKVPLKYKRQLIHYLYVCDLDKASIIAYQCDEELKENPFLPLTEDKLYEIEVEVTEEEIRKHQQLIEYLEFCRDMGVYPS